MICYFDKKFNKILHVLEADIITVILWLYDRQYIMNRKVTSQDTMRE